MGRVPRPTPSDEETRRATPCVFGLLALVGVAVVVGVIAGVVAIAGARVAGLDGGGSTPAAARERGLPLPAEAGPTADNGR